MKKVNSKQMFVARFADNVACPGCSWVLPHTKDRRQLFCVNPQCKYYQRKFKTPVVKLELLPDTRLADGEQLCQHLLGRLDDFERESREEARKDKRQVKKLGQAAVEWNNNAWSRTCTLGRSVYPSQISKNLLNIVPTPSFGTLGIHSLEYFHPGEKKWKTSTIKDLKVISVIGTQPASEQWTDRWNSGHCFCIVFGKAQKAAHDEICDLAKMGYQNLHCPIMLLLNGPYGVKIPVLCSEGNLYDSTYSDEYGEETGCLFAYLPPMFFDKRYDKCEYNHPVSPLHPIQGAWKKG